MRKRRPFAGGSPLLRRHCCSQPAERRRTGGPRVSGECCLCLSDIGGEDPWNCLVCSVVAHVKCMPKDPTTGKIHLENGCPQCQETFQHAVTHYKTPVPAPHGALCRVCRGEISHGARMVRCSAPRQYCIAVWHKTCSPETRCPGCRLTIVEGIFKRVR